MPSFRFDPAPDKTTITWLDPKAAAIWIRLETVNPSFKLYPTAKSSLGWAAVVPDSDIEPGKVTWVISYPSEDDANNVRNELGEVVHIFDARSGTVQIVPRPAPRLRVSIFHFNSGFYKSEDGSGNITFQQEIIDGLQSARIDEYILTTAIAPSDPPASAQFGGKPDPALVAQPRFACAPGGGSATDQAKSINFLKQAADKLHSIGRQFCAGFVCMNSPGHVALADFLADPKSDIDLLANNTVNLFTSNGIAIDGINFDIEDAKFGAAQKLGLQSWIVKVAALMKKTNGFVSYAGPTFQQADGNDRTSFECSKIQPYALAGLADNIIARPQCYLGSGSLPVNQIKTALTLAQAPISSNGGGLPPEKLQPTISGAQLPSSMTDFCRDVLRPQKLGLTIYPWMQLVKTHIFDKAKEWEAALNPGASAPNMVGAPLQMPLTRTLP